MRKIAIATALWIIGSPFATAAESASEIYSGLCANCHGPTAKGMASYPRLAGQPADYLEMRLKQYRAGETVSWNSALMIPMATDLSDAEITALADLIANEFQ
ncbi:MAG: c-type cytochrome [Pseudomonadota bacterium]